MLNLFHKESKKDLILSAAIANVAEELTNYCK